MTDELVEKVRALLLDFNSEVLACLESGYRLLPIESYVGELISVIASDVRAETIEECAKAIEALRKLCEVGK
jgi:hypothetical protein